jgi:3-methyladenine DNA glycosylase AlkD
MKRTGAAIAGEIGRRLAALPNASIPDYRRLRRELSLELREAPAPAVIAASAILSQIPLRGHRFVAYEIVQQHPTAPARLGARLLERLGRGISDWDEVDCFAVYLSGPAWRRRRISDRLIHRWASSPDRWWRRAALVSTVPLNSRAHGGAGDARRTLRVCRMLEADRDPMIVKALSWALRELAKRDPTSVRRFLADRGAALAPLVRREVRNKLDTGLKNPRKTRATAR